MEDGGPLLESSIAVMRRSPVDGRHVGSGGGFIATLARALHGVKRVVEVDARGGHEQRSARIEHARHLADRLDVVGNVLDNAVAQDEVEATVGERQALCVSRDEVSVRTGGESGWSWVEVDADVDWSSIVQP